MIVSLRDLSLLSSLLSSKKVIFGRQEAYLGDSECSPAGCAPVVSPAPDSREVDVGGDCTGGTDRGVGVGGVDTSNDDEGVDTAGVNVGGE
jgi:hypothetical protein